MIFTEEAELDALARRHPNLAGGVNSFRRIVKGATWKKPSDIKGQPHGTFKGSADPVACASGRTVWVFDVAGDNLRVIATVDYEDGNVTVLWTGTHREYDTITVAKKF